MAASGLGLAQPVKDKTAASRLMAATAFLSAFICFSFLVFATLFPYFVWPLFWKETFPSSGTGTGNKGKVPCLMVTMRKFYDDAPKESIIKSTIPYTGYNGV